MDAEIEQKVLSFVADFAGREPNSVSLASRLQADLGIVGGDAVDLMEKYGQEFHVDLTDLDLRDHFDTDLLIEIPRLLESIVHTLRGLVGLGPGVRHKIKDLAVADLVAAAKEGRWPRKPRT